MGAFCVGETPAQPVVNTVDVPDLESAMARVSAIGGQLATPKMAIPGIGWLCYAKDPDQNLFGMLQNDPTAK